MPINSRQKGATGERELARYLREHGYNARRGQQYSGANGDADVVGLPGFHIEVKRTERFEVYKALTQAQNDAKMGEIPLVCHRKNRGQWIAVLSLKDLLELIDERYKESVH